MSKLNIEVEVNPNNKEVFMLSITDENGKVEHFRCPTETGYFYCTPELTEKITSTEVTSVDYEDMLSLFSSKYLSLNADLAISNDTFLVEADILKVFTDMVKLEYITLDDCPDVLSRTIATTIIDPEEARNDKDVPQTKP